MTAPVDAVLDRLRSASCSPRRRGSNWIARCPAHDDHTPSLSVGVGSDGRVLLHCFAGCTADAVCSALGLKTADLFDPATRQDGSRPKGAFASPEEVIAFLCRTRGEPTAIWRYTNADGRPVGFAVRFDDPREDGDKVVLPVSLQPGGWMLRAMPPPRPLYRLAELKDADRVIVCEGEKAADAAASLGLAATTSAGGCEAPAKADWSPLAGKECVILPDHDEPGRAYARRVISILSALRPVPTIRVVELPDLPESGDIVEFIEACGGDPEAARRQIDALAGAAEPIQPPASVSVDGSIHETEPFEPFPIQVLPEPVRSLIRHGAEALFCDPTMIALPCLAVLAACVGATRRIVLKSTWREYPAIWSAVVVRSGSNKTAAYDLAVGPLLAEQDRRLADHERLAPERARERLEYEAAITDWKRSGRKRGDLPPAEPEPPPAPQTVVGDATIEAVARLLKNNPRGLLVARDEIGGWLLSFGQYKAGRSGDAQGWLELHRAGPLLVNRATREPIRVPRALVSITGTIQPGTLSRTLGVEHFESGLAARFVLAMPPQRVKRWSQEGIPAEVTCGYERLISSLLALGFGPDGEPVDVPLSEEGRSAWVGFYDGFARAQAEADNDADAACLAKLEAYAARFALLACLVRHVTGPPWLGDLAVGGDDVEAGVALTRWFAHEARRVYQMLGQTDEQQDRRRLVELIQSKGGTITPRDLMRSSSRLRTAQDARHELDELVRAGVGVWETPAAGPGGGRPSRRFRLAQSPPAPVDTTPAADHPSPVPTDNTPDADHHTGGCVTVSCVNGASGGCAQPGES